MRTKLLLVLATLFALAGLSMIFYPTYQTETLRKAEQDSITAFEQYRETATAKASPAASCEATEPCSPTDKAVSPAEPQAAARIFPALWAACRAYNEQLVQTQRASYTAESMRRAPIQLYAYGYEQEVFGYISIPTAEIEVPIYLGANDTNLNKGAAVLGQTSLPIGGASTNCVIAGHRTWSGAVQFKGLEHLQVGDWVYLTNPWETLTYQVVETKTVLPDAMSEVLIQEDRDLLTIFTCASPNSHRYLVICERCPEGGSTPCNLTLLPWVASLSN